MKSWIRYGVLNSVIGLMVGCYVTWNAIGEGYYVFIFAAPVAVFITGGLLWKLFMKKNENPGMVNVIVTGLLTGTVSHYVTFLLIGIGLNLCFRITGECTGFFGSLPATISGILSEAFLFTFFSLMLFGWVTAPASMIIGLALKRTEDKKILLDKNKRTE